MKMQDIDEMIKAECREVANSFDALQICSASICQAIVICIDALEHGNRLLVCGNGGSASEAQHFAAELVGRYKFDRKPLAALALSVDTSILTAVANDYGFEYVYSRQVEGLGSKGDVLIGFSTSGNSPNVLRAFACARENGIKTIALTGSDGGSLAANSEVTICVPAQAANHIQEMHTAVSHIICGAIERKFVFN